MKKTSESQLKAIKKWRDNNREKYNEKAKAHSNKYYQENKEKILEKKRLCYMNKKIANENKEINEISAEIIE